MRSQKKLLSELFHIIKEALSRIITSRKSAGGIATSKDVVRGARAVEVLCTRDVINSPLHSKLIRQREE